MTTFDFRLWLRRQRIALGIAFLLLAGTGVVKWQAGLMPEDTYVPSPVMPSPNARDYFTAAEALLPDGNVFFDAMNPMDANEMRRTGYHVDTLAEKEKFVAPYLPAIAKLRDGLKYPYMAPQLRSFDTRSPNSKDETMVFLLVLEGQTRAAHGDWGGAMNDYLDVMNIGSDLPHGAPMSGMLTGMFCEAEARGRADKAIGHLSAGQAEAAARRLANINAVEAEPAQILQEEEWSTKGSLLGVFHKPSWRTAFSSGITGDSSERVQQTFWNFRLRTESAREAYDNYSRYMDAGIAYARLPWPVARLVKLPPLPSDPVDQSLTLSCGKFVLKQLGIITLDRFLEVQIALRAYRLDHGRYPAELADLLPTYLPTLPLDPFSDNKAFRYRLNGSGYLLYSIGPDAVDNGGGSMVDLSHRTIRNYAFNDANISGDVVAVNY